MSVSESTSTPGAISTSMATVTTSASRTVAPTRLPQLASCTPAGTALGRATGWPQPPGGTGPE